MKYINNVPGQIFCTYSRVPLPVVLNILRFDLFIFRKRGREGEREGKKHHCVIASHVPPTGELAHNPGMCPDWESNR